MPNPVTRASDHDPNLSTYCTVADVVVQAAGIDPDDSGNVLSRLGSVDDRDAYIESLLSSSFRQINRWARRDFGYHYQVEVTLDGNALDSFILADLGFWPLLAITGLTIDGDEIDSGDYLRYFNNGARLEYNDQSVYEPPIVKRKRTTRFFTEGVQNVVATLTWGYSAPPDDIRLAQSLETLAMIMLMYSSRDDPRDPGIPSGVQAISETGFRVSFGQRGRYGDDGDKFREEARRICYRYHRAIVSILQPPTVI